VRWDGGIEVGTEVSLFYDPMLAKLIVHGPDRATAIARMRRALDELTVVGIETSASFHRRVMQEPDFIAGNLSIRYLEEHAQLLKGGHAPERLKLVALAAALLEEERANRSSVPRITRGSKRSSWRGDPSGTSWRGDRSW
jgi:acetyl/propionyl-CoA carboxylase alpha subunit